MVVSDADLTNDHLVVAPRECRACMQVITPIKAKRITMCHQAGYYVGGFQLYTIILCCPKCGEKDL